MSVAQAQESTHRSARVVDGRPRLSFARILSSEFIKLTSLGSTYWGLLLGVGGMAMLGLAVVSGAEYAHDIEFDLERSRAAQHSALTVGVAFGQIVVAVVSVLSVTSEFSSGSIRVTLAAVPSRLPVLFAKCVTAAAFALGFGLMSLAVSLAITAPMFAAKGYSLYYTDPYVFIPLSYSLVYLMIIAVFNVCVGTLMRSTVLGLLVVISLMQVVPILLGVSSNALKLVWLANIGSLLPTNSVGGPFFAYLGPYDPPELFDGIGYLQLAPWQAFAVILCWMLAALACAIVDFRRRDL